MEEEYPIAFLNQITVDEEFRRNDNHYGSCLLCKFEEISTDYGCKLAACQVAWPEGLSTREGNILFYKNGDWDLYEPSVNEQVMAFKVLVANAPKKALNPQIMSTMVVYWKDENFPAPFVPKPAG